MKIKAGRQEEFEKWLAYKKEEGREDFATEITMIAEQIEAWIDSDHLSLDSALERMIDQRPAFVDSQHPHALDMRYALNEFWGYAEQFEEKVKARIASNSEIPEPNSEKEHGSKTDVTNAEGREKGR